MPIKLYIKNTLRVVFAGPWHHMTKGRSEQHYSTRKEAPASARVANLWNQVLENRVSAESTQIFKCQIDKDWLRKEFMFNWEVVESSTRK